MPRHDHPMMASVGPASTDSDPRRDPASTGLAEAPRSQPLTRTDEGAGGTDPSASVLATADGFCPYAEGAPSEEMGSGAVETLGGGQPHHNMMPFLGINFIIALVGIYPSRQ